MHKGLSWKPEILDFKPDFTRKSTDPGSAAISYAISQPISTKLGKIAIFGSGSVVVRPELTKSKSVAMEICNADFEALFGQERVGFCHGFHSK